MDAKLLKRLVTDPVQSEPFSGSISLLYGNLQGKSRKIRGFDRFRLPHPPENIIELCQIP